jgi:hypothetical protein
MKQPFDFVAKRFKTLNNTALNPLLYDRLSAYGDVLMANEGMALVLGRPALDPLHGRYRPNVVMPGEYYRINCPYCQDTRQRLWINHRFGTMDSETDSNFDHMAICYNEDCLADYTLRDYLLDRVYGFRNRNERRSHAVVIRPGTVPEVSGLKEVTWPGSMLKLSELKPTDKARRYLEARNFDPDTLATQFDVRYCALAAPEYRLAQGRLIIPVYFRKKLVGWQGRFLGDIDFKRENVPKYYTMPGFARRLVFYNYDQMRTGRLAIITEGVTDVWRLGAAGLAVLGSGLSAPQVGLLKRWQEKKDGLIVLLLDGDAPEKADKAYTTLTATIPQRQVCRISLPSHRDPGDFAPDVLRRVLRTQCQEQGVNLKTYE